MGFINQRSHHLGAPQNVVKRISELLKNGGSLPALPWRNSTRETTVRLGPSKHVLWAPPVM